MASTSFLTFGIGDTLLGLPAEMVEETLPLRPVSPLVELPDYVLGSFRYRGAQVLLLDLALLLGQEPRPPTPVTRLLLLHPEGGRTFGRIAMRVDCVLDVAQLAEGQISPLLEELHQLLA